MSLMNNIRSKKYLDTAMVDYGLTTKNRYLRSDLNNLKDRVEDLSGNDNPIASRQFIADLEAERDTITPPVAAFTADATTGNTASVFTFTSTSTGGELTYAWNFGDETTSTLEEPTHTYEALGTFSVTLTVTNIEGTDTQVREDYIVITEGE